MKILILYAKVGNGHFKAAEAIKLALEEKYKDVEVDFEDGLEYSSAITNKLIIKGYASMIKHIPELWGNIYSNSDIKDKSAIAEINKTVDKTLTIKLKKMLREKKPDIIVSTHPFISHMCGYLKRKKKTTAKIVTVITDYATHNMWMQESEYMDKYIVATEDVKRVCMKYGVLSENIITAGIPISPEFLKEYDRLDTLNSIGLDDKFTFLFFAGGGLGLGKSTEIFEEIIKNEKDFQMIAVTGKNEKQKQSFEEIANKYDRKVLVLGYTNEVPKLMQASDIVITKPGGLTSSECIATKKPMVIINPIPGQEEQNTMYFVNNGAAVMAGEINNINNVINMLLTNDLRIKQMKEICGIIGKKNSAFDIADILYNLKTEKA